MVARTASGGHCVAGVWGRGIGSGTRPEEVAVEWALAEVIATAVLIGLVPASIARRKGRDFLAWWFFGAMMFVFALPAALLLRPIGLGRPAPKP